jgi:hypothetical protein
MFNKHLAFGKVEHKQFSSTVHVPSSGSHAFHGPAVDMLTFLNIHTRKLCFKYGCLLSTVENVGLGGFISVLVIKHNNMELHA